MNNRKKYSAIDLFAGAGGLSCGFEAEDIEIPLAIEKDSWAAETYKCNHKNKNCVEADITLLDNNFFKDYTGKIDIVMGGPPCQGFSIAASNRRDPNDKRNLLYRHFLKVVEAVKPKLVLIENVKEFSKYHLPEGGLLIDDVTAKLDLLGYNPDYTIVEVKKYGIPQDRRRFFLLAVRKDIHTEIRLNDTLKDYEEPELTIWDAISDLPVVKPFQYDEDSVLPYSSEPNNAYQQLLRNGSNGVYNHIPMQHTQRTVEKFQFLLNHQGNELELPDSLKSRKRSNPSEISSSKYGQNHRIIDPNKVSPTITASFYSSFIHPYQPRNLTVREAARIQSFPDTFVFKGKKTTLSKKLLKRKGIDAELHLDQFNQVGNAVPPKMASIMAKICKHILNNT